MIRTRSLVVPLVMSATAHALVLLPASVHFRLPGTPASAGSVRVQLVAAGAARAPKPAVKPATPGPIPLPTAPAVPTASAAWRRGDLGEALVAARVRAYVQRVLPDYFVYPELARRRGWEGTVILIMDIDEHGTIKTVQVKRGSGYGILDRAAVSTVNRIGTIKDEDLGANRGMTVRLAIRYQLLNS